MRRAIVAGGFLGVFLGLAPGCSGSTVGGCSQDSECGYGQYCALGVCKKPLGTTGTSATGAAATGTASGGGTTGPGTTGTTGGTSSGVATSSGTTGGSTGTTGTTGGSTGTTGGSSTGAPSIYCMPCQQQTDCGDGGDFCVQLQPTDPAGHCGIVDPGCNEMTTNEGAAMCSAADETCYPIQDSSTLQTLGYNCLPTSDSCPTTPTTDGGTCAPCTQDSDCGAGDICISPTKTGEYFCAVDCTKTLSCANAADDCTTEFDVSGPAMDGCVPSGGCGGGGACTQDSDCGAGNLCVSVDGIDFVCGADCSQTFSCVNGADECCPGIDENGDPEEICAPISDSCD